MLGKLIPTKGGDPIPLTREVIVIGRRSSCDIQLEFANISSQHCQLEFVDGYWWVRDLNSRNGIKLNDERCTHKIVMPGDRLAIAKHEFEVFYTPTGEAPPTDLQENIFSMSLMEKAGLERVRRPSSGPRKKPPFDPQNPAGAEKGGTPSLQQEFSAKNSSPRAQSAPPKPSQGAQPKEPEVDDDDVASWLNE